MTGIQSIGTITPEMIGNYLIENKDSQEVRDMLKQVNKELAKPEEERLEKLLSELIDKSKGKINPNSTGGEYFLSELENSIRYSSSKNDDCLEMIELLLDDSNLICGSEFNKNFKMNLLDELVPLKIRTNKSFRDLFQRMMTLKLKGVGAGEMVLTLIVKDWKFSSTNSDGDCGGAREIKSAAGSCLKPISSGLTSKGLVDVLNIKYLDGGIPGGCKGGHELFLASFKKNPSAFLSYLKELYPSADVQPFYNSFLRNLNLGLVTRKDFDLLHGLWVLERYRTTDGWKSISFINSETFTITNMVDLSPSSVSDFGISFRARMSRTTDSNAVPDGYSIVRVSE